MLKHYLIKKITPVYSMYICDCYTTLDEMLFHFYNDYLSQCEVEDILYLIEDDKLIQGTLLVVSYKKEDYLNDYV